MNIKPTACFFLLLSILSCKNDSKQKRLIDRSATSATGKIQYEIADSIPLFNGSHAYSYINLQKADSGMTIAFQHPGLNLDIIDKKGMLVKKIGIKGSLPENFKGDYLETSYSQNGRFYVLDESAAVWLKVYDANLNYLKTINLYRHLKDYTVPPVTGSFLTISLNDSVDRFVITPISTVMIPTDKEFYEKNPIVIQFDLYLNDYSVRNIKPIMKLSDLSSIADALVDNEKKWEDAVPLLKYYQHHFYIKLPFDNDIYKYDSSWKLVNKYVLNPVYEPFDFFTEFKPARTDTKKSFINQMRFQFSNLSYNTMCISGNKICLLYPKPIDKDNVPSSPQEWQKYLPAAVLHIIDMASGKQYSADLPPSANTFFLHPVSDSSFYVTQHPFSGEDLYAYKINIKY
jgi:hypothetical protein